MRGFTKLYEKFISKKLPRFQKFYWAGAVAQQTLLHLQAPACHKGACLCPGCSISDPAICLGPGTAAEDGIVPWDTAPLWETQRKLLVLMSIMISN